MVIYLAIFVVFVVAAVFGYEAVHTTSKTIATSQISVTAQVAQAGASVYEACMAKGVATGSYTASQLISGAGNKTALGNGWTCMKAAGGVYNQDLVVVYYDGPITRVPGSAQVSQASTQNDYAYQVAGKLVEQADFSQNTVIGVVEDGKDTLQSLLPAGQNFQIFNKSPGYATPVLVGNYLATGPTN